VTTFSKSSEEFFKEHIDGKEPFTVSEELSIGTTWRLREKTLWDAFFPPKMPKTGSFFTKSNRRGLEN